MEITLNSLYFNDLSENEIYNINGGLWFPSIVIFGITISAFVWVPLAIAGACLLVAGVYVGFKQTYEDLKRQYN